MTSLSANINASDQIALIILSGVEKLNAAKTHGVTPELLAELRDGVARHSALQTVGEVKDCLEPFHNFCHSGLARIAGREINLPTQNERRYALQLAIIVFGEKALDYLIEEGINRQGNLGMSRSICVGSLANLIADPALAEDKKLKGREALFKRALEPDTATFSASRSAQEQLGKLVSVDPRTLIYLLEKVSNATSDKRAERALALKVLEAVSQKTEGEDNLKKVLNLDQNSWEKLLKIDFSSLEHIELNSLVVVALASKKKLPASPYSVLSEDQQSAQALGLAVKIFNQSINQDYKSGKFELETDLSIAILKLIDDKKLKNDPDFAANSFHCLAVLGKEIADPLFQSFRDLIVKSSKPHTFIIGLVALGDTASKALLDSFTQKDKTLDEIRPQLIKAAKFVKAETAEWYVDKMLSMLNTKASSDDDRVVATFEGFPQCRERYSPTLWKLADRNNVPLRNAVTATLKKADPTLENEFCPLNEAINKFIASKGRDTRGSALVALQLVYECAPKMSGPNRTAVQATLEKLKTGSTVTELKDHYLEEDLNKALAVLGRL